MSVQAKITKRLLPLYAATGFGAIVFWYSIEKLFMRSIGFTDAGIGLVITLIGVTTLVFGIPSGVIADKWSRKGVMMIAYASLALSHLIGGLSYNPFVYGLMAISWGLFFALQDGVQSSIIYDTVLEESGSDKDFAKYYGRNQLILSAFLIAGSLTSIALANSIGLRGTYFASIPAALLAVITLSFFREPTLHQQNSSGFKSRIRDVSTFLRQRGVVGWMITSLFLIVVMQRAVFELYQLWLIALVIPITYYGIIAAAAQSSIGLSGVIGHRLLKNRSALWVFLLAGFASAVGTLIHVAYIAIPSLVFLLIWAFTLHVVMQQYVHGTLESHIRASGLSVAGTLGEIGFFAVAPLMGYLSGKYSAFTMGWVLVVLSVLAVASVSKVLVAHEAHYQE